MEAREGRESRTRGGERLRQDDDGAVDHSPAAEEWSDRRGSHPVLGKDLATIKESELRRIRWKHIAIVFQGAMNALNPVKRVSWQIAEAIALHDNMSFDEAQGRVVELLELVGINPARKDEYPHEFSGGMRQRVMIAMALACRPKIIIADEPVTALDVMIQAQILELLTKLQKELDLSMILISHDLSVIAQTCDKVAIMYGGKIAEYGPAEEVFLDPQHPYTQGLLRSFPDIYGPRDLPPWIPGQPPNLLEPPDGCRFHERCPLAFAECLVREPPLYETRPGHLASCHLRAPSN